MDIYSHILLIMLRQIVSIQTSQIPQLDHLFFFLAALSPVTIAHIC